MEPERVVVFVAVTLPFVVAGTIPFLYNRMGDRTGYVGAAVASICFGLLGSQYGTDGTISASWIPTLDVALRFHVDGWALLFALLASGVGVLVFLYSVRYMHGERNLARYYATLLAFMGSIVGVALAADLILLFLFWELTSLCSFVLIGHDTESTESRYAARMAMLVTVGGGLCLLAGLLLLSIAAESAFGAATFDLARMLANVGMMEPALRETGLYLPTLALIVIAAGAKSAQVPLHFWLPNAMVAPTPVSAFLHSATMVKVGVYVIGRLRPLLGGPEWTIIVATIGLATMTVGAILAVASTDLKQLLAYSTASHLGLMVAGFGFATVYGAEAGVFHLLNHALFKAALFLVAGIVAHEVGTRRLDALGGLWRDLPATALVTGIAALSMAGIPPLNGFYSKELLFEATVESARSIGGVAWIYPAIAVVASTLTVLYSIRFLSIFLGERPTDLDVGHRPPVAMLIAPGTLAALTAAISASPQTAVDLLVQSAVGATATGEPAVHVGLPGSLTLPVAMSGVAIVAGVLMFPYYDRIQRVISRTIDASGGMRPTEWYDGALTAAEFTSARIDPLVHHGRLRAYVAWVFVVACGLALSGYLATGVGTVRIVPLVATPAMTLVLVVAIVAAVAVTAAPSHVAGVLTLSILGFMVAIFYILASAPDLALTQLVVETLVLVIFLLVLEEMPAFYADVDIGVVIRDSAISLVVGITAFLTVLLSVPAPTEPPTELARYFTSAAVPEGGGANVVNVILVDFRGFDTLGELLVIAIAAISVIVLITMRDRGETR